MLEVADKIPIAHNSCRIGKRFSFLSEGHPALLLSLQALDEGDPNKMVKFRDKITYMCEQDNFEQEFDLVRTELRCGGLDIFENGLLGILTERWWKQNHQSNLFVILRRPFEWKIEIEEES